MEGGNNSNPTHHPPYGGQPGATGGRDPNAYPPVGAGPYGPTLTPRPYGNDGGNRNPGTQPFAPVYGTMNQPHGRPATQPQVPQHPPYSTMGNSYDIKFNGTNTSSPMGSNGGTMFNGPNTPSSMSNNWFMFNNTDVPPTMGNNNNYGIIVNSKGIPLDPNFNGNDQLHTNGYSYQSTFHGLAPDGSPLMHDPSNSATYGGWTQGDQANIYMSDLTSTSMRPMGLAHGSLMSAVQDVPKPGVSARSTPSPARSLPSTPDASVDRNGDFALSFSNSDEARAHLHRRVELTVPGDDVDHVRNNQEYYVREIIRAIERTAYTGPPAQMKKGRSLANDEKEAWKNWQEAAAEKAAQSLEFADNDELEARAWLIVGEMLRVHDCGYRLSTKAANDQLKCTQRLDQAIAVTKDYAIIRSDILSHLKIEEFCANPEGFIQSKIDNLWVNFNKKKRNAINQQKNQASPDAESDELADQQSVAGKVKGKSTATPVFSRAAAKVRFTKDQRKELRKQGKNGKAKKTGKEAKVAVEQSVDALSSNANDGTGSDVGASAGSYDPSSEYEAGSSSPANNSETQVLLSDIEVKDVLEASSRLTMKRKATHTASTSDTEPSPKRSRYSDYSASLYYNGGGAGEVGEGEDGAAA